MQPLKIQLLMIQSHELVSKYALYSTEYIMGRTVIQIANKPKVKIRVLFWGMDGEFSRKVLINLIEEGIQPVGIVIPDFQGNHSPHTAVPIVPESPVSPLPLKNPYIHNSIFQAAFEHQIPLFKVRDLAAQQTVQLLRETRPTVAMVACFPRRIPQKMLNLPSAGFLNLHPSLLPSLRGPHPLFWTFRLGLKPGLSVHFMDDGLDTGDIVLQKAVEFPDGVSGLNAETIMAKQGASLLAKAYRQLVDGTLTKIAQQEVGSSYPKPKPDDFLIPTSWTARRAFNFIRGTSEWEHSFLIHGPDLKIRVRSAVSFDLELTLAQSHQREKAEVWIRFASGTLHARQ